MLADPAAIVTGVRPSCSPFLWYSPPQSLLCESWRKKISKRLRTRFLWFLRFTLWCSPPKSATTDPLNQCFLIPSSRSRRLRNFLSFLGLILYFLFSFFSFFQPSSSRRECWHWSWRPIVSERERLTDYTCTEIHEVLQKSKKLIECSGKRWLNRYVNMWVGVYCGFSSNWILHYFPLFVRVSVTSVTSHISHKYKGINAMLIIWGPIKPCIFWIKIILAIFLAKTIPSSPPWPTWPLTLTLNYHKYECWIRSVYFVLLDLILSIIESGKEFFVEKHENMNTKKKIYQIEKKKNVPDWKWNIPD